MPIHEGEMFLNNSFNSFLELICFDLVYNNLDLLVGGARTPHFYDFGSVEPVVKPQNQHYLFLETPGHLKKIKKFSGAFLKILSCKCKNVGSPKCRHLSKRRAWENNEDPSTKISKNLDMYFISIRKHEMKIW